MQVGAETSSHAYRQPVAVPVLAGTFFGYGVNVLEDYDVSNQDESSSLPFCNTYCLSCARIGETGQVRYASRVGRLLC